MIDNKILIFEIRKLIINFQCEIIYLGCFNLLCSAVSTIVLQIANDRLCLRRISTEFRGNSTEFPPSANNPVCKEDKMSLTPILVN